MQDINKNIKIATSHMPLLQYSESKFTNKKAIAPITNLALLVVYLAIFICGNNIGTTEHYGRLFCS